MSDVLNSLFTWHNETVNVWSHLLGVLLWLAIITFVARNFPTFKQDNTAILYDNYLTELKNPNGEDWLELEKHCLRETEIFFNITGSFV